MKKFSLVLMLLTLSLALILTGCGASEEPEPETDPVGEETNGDVVYDDGSYRGIYADRGDEQVGIQFEIEDNVITDVSYRQLYYGGMDYLDMDESDPMYGIKVQHDQIADYLIGEPLEAIYDLHSPGEFVEDIDGFSGATVRANKVFSAIKDGLNRGVYSPANGVSRDIASYDDGSYRGIYADRGDEQVGIQFELENNVITDVSYRQLYYGGMDYRDMDENDPMYGIKVQHDQIAEYLIGEPLEAIYDLHSPGEFVEDIDGFSGATVRANKVFSAIKNGLSRGVYSK